MRMFALDGNAIAGPLFEYFGHEMTDVAGRCRHCWSVSLIAELAVYTKAPGSVARCQKCGNVVMVLVNVHGSEQLYAECFELPEALRRQFDLT